MSLKEILYEWNPFWVSGEIKRETLGIERISPYLKLFDVEDMIKAIIGPRRAGKTTLMFQYINRLLERGVEPTSILYVDLEDPAFESYSLRDIYEEFLRITRTKINYIFFDEIQNKENWHKWVRAFFEKESNSIFISGSTSSLINKEVSSLLAGRVFSIKVFPLSFFEILRSKGISFSSKKEKIIASSLLSEMLVFGGFPRVFKEANPSIKRTILKEYVNTVVSRDVAERFSLDYTKALEIFEYLVRNVSSLSSINKLRKLFKVRYEVIERYLEAFKSSFIVLESRRYSFSLKEQLAFPRKFYVIDNGFRTVFPSPSEDKGRWLENLIASELYKHGIEFFYYKGKGECDFLIVENGKPFLALQVCYELNEKNEERELKGLEEVRNKFRVLGKLITFENAPLFLNLLPNRKKLFKWLETQP